MMKAKLATLFILSPILLALGVPAGAREWKDKSGRYSVDAELVSANKELVVLRTADHRLIALDLIFLSEGDQQFVRLTLAKATRPGEAIAGVPGSNPLVASKDLRGVENSPLVDVKPAPSVGEASTVEPKQAAIDGGWRLIDGQVVQGEFMGFDLQPLVIKRALSEVYVGGVLFSKLDPIYRRILPMTIAHLENAKIEDVQDIEAWLKKSGPGPWTYKIESVLIETAKRGTVSIPTFLLDKRTVESIAVSLRRWREALATDVSEEDRNLYFDRERFLTRASMTAQQADENVERQAQYMRLELLAAASGVTDLWSVSLIPRVGYGHPFTAVVPGQNSQQAEAVATRRYPGHTVGGIIKQSR